MTIEEALIGALKYETRVRDVYLDAARGTREESARALYEFLGKDEQSHIDYLNHALKRWKNEHSIDLRGLGTSLPSIEKIDAAAKKAGASLREARTGKDQGGDTNALQRALKAERETSAYYQSLADSMTDAARAVFQRFVEIEDGHTRIVQAEFDLATRTGYWFDVREFDQED